MHTLFDNVTVVANGTPGVYTSAAVFGGVYVSASDTTNVSILLVGTGSVAAGTINVYQGTDSTGAGAKLVTGRDGTATLSFGTVGTAFGITVNVATLDLANGYTWVAAIGTIASTGTFRGASSYIKSNIRLAPASGLNGSVYIVT